MAWSIPASEHKVFERNPLVAVVVELRFHPILQVPNRVADFQDRVRTRFPGYQELARQVVTMGPLVPVELRPEKLFNFHKADESATLTLSTGSLVLESRRHEHREAFISEARIGIEALEGVYGPIAPVRLGLRYVDAIDKRKIEQDLGRPTSWTELIAEPFLRVPTGLADLNGTLFASEVGSTMPTGGGMTVRHGLVQDVDGATKFRLDVDRYIDGAVDLTGAVDLLRRFAQEIFSVFSLSMGPDLKVWMPERTT